MYQSLHVRDAEVMDQAMTAFLLDAGNAKNKHTRIKINMECRRKLEIQNEQRRLARETSEFDFS